MRNLDLTIIDQPTQVLRLEDQRLPVDEGIEVNQSFHNKED
jgi:hypothetical protein